MLGGYYPSSEETSDSSNDNLIDRYRFANSSGSGSTDSDSESTDSESESTDSANAKPSQQSSEQSSSDDDPPDTHECRQCSATKYIESQPTDTHNWCDDCESVTNFERLSNGDR